MPAETKDRRATGKARTSREVAARFDELAQQEKWFEIQDELFADDVRSVEPRESPLFPNAEGKQAVRKKAEDVVRGIEDVHEASTTHPLVSGNHFAVGRILELTSKELGRIRIDQIMLYEVRNGQIVLEQFFY
jgi:ketosteroid isomerase-like protein